MKISTLYRGMVGGIIALLLVSITLPAPRVQAATHAELQAQIQSLLTQIATLQAQLLAMQSGTVCVYPQQHIAYGERSSQVAVLQQFLMSRGHVIPAGATGYFGAQTQTALQQFQATQGISPALGYNYGPLTMAKAQSLCTVPPTPTPTPTPEPKPEPEPPLSGEASLERFTVKDGNNTDLEEGDGNAEIMEVSFRVEDGDARLNRVEVGFTPDNANDEDDPWDTFEEVSIWNSNTRLARVDASNRNNWIEDSPTDGDYTIRLSGLDWRMREGREIELTVRVDVQNGVRGTDNGEIWTAYIPDEGIRALDADRAALYIGDTADAVTLNIDEAGASDEIITRRSDDDPDASVLRVKDDRNSGYLEVFAFDLDTHDSENDIDIYELPIQFTVSSGTLSDFVRNARIIIDGETYTDEHVTDGATGIITFSFDYGDLQIDAGDRVTASVEIDFRSLNEEFEGISIVGHIDADDIDAEGGDDLDSEQLQGAVTGETHLLYTKGTDVESPTATAEVTSVSGSNNDYVTFVIRVAVAAFGQDVYIPVGTDGVDYQLQDSLGNALAASGTPVVTSSAEEEGNYFYIPEGSTETVTLTVTHLPGVPNTTARMQLLSINYNDTDAAPDQSWNALPQSSYRTP
ncbi:peptidoglycan-binding protein, partial [Candidatus Kaiserbacteria bacterium]|nr:peptidoglycan-binding protein [Candidatus Kaiserbacteria bacterium]